QPLEEGEALVEQMPCPVVRSLVEADVACREERAGSVHGRLRRSRQNFVQPSPYLLHSEQCPAHVLDESSEKPHLGLGIAASAPVEGSAQIVALNREELEQLIGATRHPAVVDPLRKGDAVGEVLIAHHLLLSGSPQAL